MEFVITMEGWVVMKGREGKERKRKEKRGKERKRKEKRGKEKKRKEKKRKETKRKGEGFFDDKGVVYLQSRRTVWKRVKRFWCADIGLEDPTKLRVDRSFG